MPIYRNGVAIEFYPLSPGPQLKSRSGVLKRLASEISLLISEKSPNEPGGGQLEVDRHLEGM